MSSSLQVFRVPTSVGFLRDDQIARLESVLLTPVTIGFLFSRGAAALLILKIVENGMLQSGVTPRKVGDRKTGTAIAPATFQKKAAQKSSRSGQRGMPGRCAFAISQHLLCTQRCISLPDHLPVMIGVAHRVVQDIATNNSCARSLVHPDRFMDQAFTPASAPAIEKPKLIIRIPAATANPTAHVERASRHAISVQKHRVSTAAQRCNRAV